MNFSGIKNSFFSLFHSQSTFETIVRKNISSSIVLKGVSILSSFLLFPVCIKFVDETDYGIWLILYSFINWINYFDVGLTQGLRNRLTESIAEKDYSKSKQLISTTFFLLLFISIVFLIIFIFLNKNIVWYKIVNVNIEKEVELRKTALIVFCSFFLRFPLKTITSVFYAFQKAALAQLLSPAVNIISLVIVFCISFFYTGSLLMLATILSLSSLIVFIALNILFFRGDNKKYTPSIRSFRINMVKSLFDLGLKFFLIQVSVMILFQSTNILIAQFFSPQKVTEYNIAYKYFSVLYMITNIITTPYWSAFTKSWAINDTTWIKNNLRKLLHFGIIVTLVGFIMLVFSNVFYKIWIGSDVKVSFSLSVFLYIYFVILTFGGIFNTFINGVGKIQVQLYSNIISVCIFFPLVFLLIKTFNMGVNAIIISSIISNFYHPIIAPIQCLKLIRKKAVGIWNK